MNDRDYVYGELRHLAPAPGKTIRDPGQKYRAMPAEGYRVAISTYWLRRLRDGGVVDLTDATAAKPKSAGNSAAAHAADKE
jgi:hypothetical protein